jgi:predicted NBD/HSP70 family sugar kinase
MAERAVGGAVGVDDFVLVWIGVGLGLATVLRGRLHRGAGGAAGEIGYLPVPGVPLPQDVGHPATGAFQSLVGGQAVLPLASRYGFAAATPGAAVAAAVAAGAAGDQRGTDFIADLASRVATGVAAISVVLDPALVVLGGEVGRAGGMALASRVAAGVTRICPARPRVVPTAVAGPPVLCGAILTAVDQARADLLDSVATPQPTPVEAPAS